MPDAVRERRRAEILGTIPEGYRPWVHLAIPSAFGVGVAALALGHVTALAPLQLLAVPVTLLASFGLEWRAHKYVLHQRRRFASILYERHELKHHVLFTYDDLAMRSRREMWLILMPPYAIVGVFGVVAPMALATALLASVNAAMLVVATSMGFFLSYEWLHLAYHLPPESSIGRLGIIRRLRELHRRHHDPRLMKRWNFNVTVPIFDVIHRTLWSPDRERERDRNRATGDRAGATARAAQNG